MARRMNKEWSRAWSDHVWTAGTVNYHPAHCLAMLRSQPTCAASARAAVSWRYASASSSRVADSAPRAAACASASAATASRPAVQRKHIPLKQAFFGTSFLTHQRVHPRAPPTAAHVHRLFQSKRPPWPCTPGAPHAKRTSAAQPHNTPCNPPVRASAECATLHALHSPRGSASPALRLPGAPWVGPCPRPEADPSAQDAPASSCRVRAEVRSPWRSRWDTTAAFSACRGPSWGRLS